MLWMVTSGCASTRMTVRTTATARSAAFQAFAAPCTAAVGSASSSPPTMADPAVTTTIASSTALRLTCAVRTASAAIQRNSATCTTLTQVPLAKADSR